jgi:hypothetical protein
MGLLYTLSVLLLPHASLHAGGSTALYVEDLFATNWFSRDPVISMYSHDKYLTVSPQIFEKIILQAAEDSQTVHYGELHGSKATQRLVASLLKEHRGQGFSYFAMELDTHEQPLIDDVLLGRIDEVTLDKKLNEISAYVSKTSGGRSRYDIKGALPLLRAAYELGYEVVLFDERPTGLTAPGDTTSAECGEPRNWAEFQNLEKLIFKKDPYARVVVFSGLDHIDERPNYTLNCGKTNQKKLGYFLEESTGGRNLSVSLGSSVHREIFKDFVRIRKPGVFPTEVDLEFSVR